MRLGATLVHLSDAPPFAIAAWAERLATAGFESLWTPNIVGRGPLVPDPFVTLATAAAVTRDVELGTATVQVPLYHPADLTPVAGRRPPLLLGSWGANVERAARDFDGWLASGYRRTPDQIIAAHERYRAAGGRRAIVCAIPLDSGDDLEPAGEALRRYAQAGFDDAVVLIGPHGPDPQKVRALLP